jgi:predicted nucleic acid-binding protein
MSADRCFIDTNIFVYVIDSDELSKSETAVRLLRTNLANSLGRISYQVVQEFLHVATKKFRTRLPPHLAWAYVDEALKPMLAVHSSLKLFDDALGIHERYKLSWYDSLIVAAAIEAKCDVLYTEDMQHGQRFGELVVTNPFL